MSMLHLYIQVVPEPPGYRMKWKQKKKKKSEMDNRTTEQIGCAPSMHVKV